MIGFVVTSIISSILLILDDISTSSISGFPFAVESHKYSSDAQYQRLEDAARDRLSIPDVRRSRLKKLLEMKTTVNAIEAHALHLSALQ